MTIQATDPSVRASIDAMVEQIDRLVEAQVRQIMAAPEMCRLRATWYALDRLVQQAAAGADVVIRVLDVSKDALYKSFQRSIAPAESPLARMVLQELDRLGGEPFHCLVGDYEFSTSPADVSLLRDLGATGAIALAPVLVGATPDLVDLESFADLATPTVAEKTCDTSDDILWRSLRERDEAHFLGLCAPRVRYDPVVGGDPRTARDTEQVSGAAARETIAAWGPAASAVAVELVRAQQASGWAANLEVLAEAAAPAVDVEVALDPDQATGLARLGVVALCVEPDCRQPILPMLPSCATVPSRRDERTADPPATDLRYVVASGRVVHALRTWLVGRQFSSLEHLHDEISRWLIFFVNPDPTTCENMKAAMPLRSREVSVRAAGQVTEVTIALGFHPSLDPSVRSTTTFELPVDYRSWEELSQQHDRVPQPCSPSLTRRLRELPFSVVVIGDFHGDQDDADREDPRLIPVAAGQIDRVLKRLRPRVTGRVASYLPSQDALNVNLSIHEIRDFDPNALVQQIEPLRCAHESRTLLRDLLAKVRRRPGLAHGLFQMCPTATARERIAERLDEIGEPLDGRDVDVLLRTVPAHRREHCLAMLREFVRGAAEPGTTPESLEDELVRRIAGLTHLLQRQVAEITSLPTYRRLEASWRGLHRLVTSAAPSPESTRVFLLSMRMEEFLGDLLTPSSLEDSRLFRLLYRDEWEVFGSATPPSLLVADYRLESDEIPALAAMARLGAVVQAPFAAAGTSLIDDADEDVEDVSITIRARNVARIFDDRRFAAWREFRRTTDARHVVLCMPRVRLERPRDELRPETNDSSTGCWGNPAYELAATAIASHRRCAWPSDLLGALRGLSEPEPIEFAIGWWRALELSRLGFAVLMGRRGTGEVRFVSTPTCALAEVTESAEANRSAQLGAQLPYVLVGHRVAQHLMRIVRESDLLVRGEAGRIVSPDAHDWERLMQDWLAEVSSLDPMVESMRARVPLLRACVEVGPSSWRPGYLAATLGLQPVYGLEAPPSCIACTVELPVHAREGHPSSTGDPTDRLA